MAQRTERSTVRSRSASCSALRFRTGSGPAVCRQRPLRVAVCGRRYVFNPAVAGDFDPSAPCPIDVDSTPTAGTLRPSRETSASAVPPDTGTMGSLPVRLPDSANAQPATTQVRQDLARHTYGGELFPVGQSCVWSLPVRLPDSANAQRDTPQVRQDLARHTYGGELFPRRPELRLSGPSWKRPTRENPGRTDGGRNLGTNSGQPGSDRRGQKFGYPHSHCARHYGICFFFPLSRRVGT
jgi:hypothetical protein